MPEILTTSNIKPYKYLSRYESFPYYYNKKDDKYIYGITGHLDNTTSFVLHEVKSNDTWDIMALMYYNNPTKYWIILDYNRINDPFTLPKIGDKIKIPVISNITYKE